METLGLILIPLFAALILLVLPERNNILIRFISLGSLLLTSFILGILLMDFNPGGGLQHTAIIPWLPQWDFNLSLGIDGISLPFLVLTALLAPLGLLYSTDIKTQVKKFHILYLILAAGSYGLLLSQNLFFIFFFLEFEVLTSYFLISFWRRAGSDKNAFQFVLFSSLAGLLFLVFMLILFFQTGAQSLELGFLKEALSSSASGNKISFFMFLLSAGILSALFPFHFWGPLGYQAASRGTNTLLAGVFKKIGPYLLIRLGLELFPAELKAYTPWLMALCLVNILYVGWVTMSQKDPKLMAGYASSSHMGFILLGILSFTTVGLTGALVLCFAHGLMTALLFANLGRIEEQTGPFCFGGVSGIGKRTPFLMFTFSAAALAGSGLPALASFVGEILVLFGLLGINKIFLVLAVFGILLSAVYFLRSIKNIFHGKMLSPVRLQDEKTAGKFASVVLLAGLILIGIFPMPFINMITPSTVTALESTEARPLHE